MDLTQRRVLMLAADDFEDMELLYPLYRLAEEGVAVTAADEATVVDGHLTSARTPADLGPWMKALLRALESPVAG
ncbi:MAG: hypothetical protein ACRDPY_07590 [Streptosporangiaceae bacterium]